MKSRIPPPLLYTVTKRIRRLFVLFGEKGKQKKQVNINAFLITNAIIVSSYVQKKNARRTLATVQRNDNFN